jgi:NRPS condensation-like uncharacterized protein/acyl carrier protein
VPEIPKGPAGKIKRDELVAALSITLPRARVERGGKLVAPRSDLEWQLANTWTELLELKQIGIDEDVFALGADSITVTQMLSRLRARFGVGISLKDIFEAPTVAALAVRLEASETAAAGSPTLSDAQTAIARVEEDGPRPVSIVQEQVLRIERELPGLPQYNLPFAYRLQGPLNIPALERSLAEVVRRHDSLHTGFSWMDERPVALIAPTVDTNSCLVVEDLAAAAPTGDERAKALLLKKAELEAEREALTPFDMNRGPLFRARLLRLDADDHVLLLVLHDLIVDGWSMGIFMEEISELYGAFAAGRPAQLPEPALQFSDFARWQRQWSTSAAATRQFANWKERLREVSPVFPANGAVEDLLPDARITREPVHVPNELVERLNALSHSQGATLFMTLLAGFKTLLLARSGRNDICVATPMANRSQPRTERVIGPVANTALICTRLDPDLSFQEALRRVRDSVLQACARQELPFDVLAARLAEEDGPDPASLTQVFFVLQNAFRRSLKLPPVAVRPFAYGEGQQVMAFDRTWLRVALKETPSGITGTCTYKNELFEPGTPQHWIEDYRTILAKAAENPETSLGRLADR